MSVRRSDSISRASCAPLRHVVTSVNTEQQHEDEKREGREESDLTLFPGVRGGFVLRTTGLARGGSGVTGSRPAQRSCVLPLRQVLLFQWTAMSGVSLGSSSSRGIASGDGCPAFQEGVEIGRKLGRRRKAPLGIHC